MCLMSPGRSADIGLQLDKRAILVASKGSERCVCVCVCGGGGGGG